MAENAKIKWEVKDHIGFVVLADKPENRMNTRFFRELKELTTSVIPAAAVNAIIISGEGRHFSSGADLEDLKKVIGYEPYNIDFLMANYQSFKYFEDSKVPVVMVVKGVCLGSGLEFALHGHFRLCSKEALLGLPETSFGLIPGAGGIEKMVQLAGKAKAVELLLGGNTFTAEEALRWNVVDAVFPKKVLMQKAIELAMLASVNYRKYNRKQYVQQITRTGKYEGI